MFCHWGIVRGGKFRLLNRPRDKVPTVGVLRQEIADLALFPVVSPVNTVTIEMFFLVFRGFPANRMLLSVGGCLSKITARAVIIASLRPDAFPRFFNPYGADFLKLFFLHLKLELLTQFPNHFSHSSWIYWSEICLKYVYSVPAS